MTVKCHLCKNRKNCGLYQNVLREGHVSPPSCTKYVETDVQQDLFSPKYDKSVEDVLEEQMQWTQGNR